jgi:small subunit ribosomal protein S16
MLAIRLARVGAKKKPSYRVVVINKRNARDGKNLEIVGHYNPTRDPIELSLESERIDHWIGVGAQASVTVKRLMAYKEKGGPTWEPSTKVVTPLPARKPKEVVVEAAAETEATEVAAGEAPAATEVAEAAPAEAPAEVAVEPEAAAVKAEAAPAETAAAPEVAEAVAETPAPEAEKAPEAAKAEEPKPPADA